MPGWDHRLVTTTSPEPTRTRDTAGTAIPRLGAARARARREAVRRASRPRMVRAPQRNRALTAVIAAAWAAGAGLLVCAALAVLAWAVGGHGDASFDEALRAGGLLYVVAHLAPVGLPAGVFSLPPLGLLGLPLLLTYRSGRWAAASCECATVPVAATLVAGCAGAYAMVTAAVSVVAAIGDARATPLTAAAAGFLVALVGVAAGVLRETGHWRELVAAVPASVRPAGTAAAATLAALGVVAGAALAATMTGHLAAVADMTGRMAPGASAGILLWLLSLLYLPTMLVWTLSYLAGPGFLLGGAAVGPFSSGGGLVPAFPLLAAVPAGPPAYAPLLLLLPVLAGAIGGGLLVRRARRGRVLLLDLLLTGALTGAATAVLCLLAAGSLGDGRLEQVGPNPWLVGLAVAGLTLLGSAPVAFAGSLVGGRLHRRPARHLLSAIVPRRRSRDAAGEYTPAGDPAPTTVRGRVAALWGRVRPLLHSDGSR